jgi:hypothetical protein
MRIDTGRDSLLYKVLIGSLAIAGVVGLLVAVTPFIDHGSIVSSQTEPATVISVASGRGASYFVRFGDGRTMVLSGPTLPLYPAGSSIMVTIDRYADGTITHTIPR